MGKCVSQCAGLTKSGGKIQPHNTEVDANTIQAGKSDKG
jgi:hypothetical protein